jgi:Zn-dependent oligopeptidase
MDSKSPNCLRFDHTAEQIKTLTESSIKEFTSLIDSVANLEGPRTFENTIIPIAKLDYDNYCVESNLTFYKDIGAEKDLREASLASNEQFDEYGINQWMRHDFYLAINAYKKQAQENGEWAKLGAEDQRYVDRLIRDFERNGLSLPDD